MPGPTSGVSSVKAFRCRNIVCTPGLEWRFCDQMLHSLVTTSTAAGRFDGER